MVVERKYERINDFGVDLCVTGVNEALSRLGLMRPILWVAPSQVPFAMYFNRQGLGGLLNVEGDPDLTDWDEWYIEYNGRRVGSEGA